jgi:murein L,D-transpeptidase YcbB/YkuD
MKRLLVVLIAVTIPAFAAEAPLTLRDAIDGAQRRGVTPHGVRICASHTLPLFYARRSYTPAWLDADAAQLLRAIEHAGDDGLRPDDYHLDAIRAAPDAMERELLLSDAFFLLASHLAAGRVDPKTIEPTWCLDARTFDLVAVLETAIENHSAGETLMPLAPRHTGYQRLRERLAAMKARPEWGVIDGGRSLRRGATGARADQLIARLAAGGDLTGPHASFDDAVDAAVRRFQHLHSLDPDGIAGPRTLRELNVPVAARVRQLELNLERWRWLPASLGDRYAIINIPEFGLRVIENERPVLSMRIVVGKDYSHQTPVFSSAITSVVFSRTGTCRTASQRRSCGRRRRAIPAICAASTSKSFAVASSGRRPARGIPSAC